MSTTETPSRWRTLAATDPEIADAIRHEQHRQNTGLELIASENFVSQAVLEAAGSVMTNKYAEGYPGKRYYGGCEFVDVAESLAIARAKQLFGAEHANVQPHSGAQANMAVYFALLQAGRHGPRHEPRPRRPPHARPSAQLLRQALHDRPVRRAQGRRADRLRRAREARARAQAEDDHGRGERLPADHRLRANRRRRQGDRRAGRHRHGAHRGSRRRRRPPQSRAALGLRDDHDAQDAARPARRHGPLPRPVSRRISIAPRSRASRAAR